MAWRSAWVLAALALPLTGFAVADHADCPRFERTPFDFEVDFHHGGDLYSRVHRVGYAEFRFCVETRTRVVEESIVWESRGGAYELHVIGDSFEERVLLLPASNRSREFDRASIEAFQAVGVSHDARVTVIPAETPPAARETSNAAPRMLGAWMR